MLVNKVYRAIDKAELVVGGTLIDAINRAHKRNLVEDPDTIRKMKLLRNEISHDYTETDLKELYVTIFQLRPILIKLTQKAIEYKIST